MKRYFLALLGPLLFPLIGTNKLDQSDSCHVARSKCAYRTNCAWALRSYMLDCADVLAGRTSNCPWACKRALISLTSSDVGYQLSTCECSENDEFCRKSKERVEVCRPEVTRATDDGTVVPCSVAQWICHADPLCSTALDYYHRLCRSLFHGRKCTPRCNNSVAILDRQEKAAKLRNCYCDGTEDFPCHSIRKNTQRLCFGRDDWVQTPTVPTSTESTSSASKGHRTVSHSNFLLASCALIYLILVQRTLRDFFRSGEQCRTSMMRHKEDEMVNSSSCHIMFQYQKNDIPWPWWWMSELAT